MHVILATSDAIDVVVHGYDVVVLLEQFDYAVRGHISPAPGDENSFSSARHGALFPRLQESENFAFVSNVMTPSSIRESSHRQVRVKQLLYVLACALGFLPISTWFA